MRCGRPGWWAGGQRPLALLVKHGLFHGCILHRSSEAGEVRVVVLVHNGHQPSHLRVLRAKRDLTHVEMRDKTVLHACDPVGVEQACEVRVVRQFVQHDSEIDRVVTRGGVVPPVIAIVAEQKAALELVDLVLPALATLAKAACWDAGYCSGLASVTACVLPLEHAHSLLLDIVASC